MAHTYHCTQCGKPVHSGGALIDFQSLLTHDTTALRRLKFRMTSEELDTLSRQDVWRPSLSELMTIIADKHNLNCPEAANLTIEDIDLALTELERLDDECDQPEDECDLPMNIFDMPDRDLFHLSSYWDEDSHPALPESVRAICDLNDAPADWELNFCDLARDLKLLKALYQGTDPEFRFQNRTIPCDDGTQILVGTAVQHAGRFWLLKDRICPHCGEPVPAEAFTVPQRIVTFFGTWATRKTSVILALAHYAQNRLVHAGYDDPIWHDTPPIPGIRRAELAHCNETLDTNLSYYGQGIAPGIPPFRRIEIPTATVHLVDDEGSESLLTLFVLPGELCCGDGRMDTEQILAEFPIVLQSDVLVHCCCVNSVSAESFWEEMIGANSVHSELTKLITTDSGVTRPVLTLFTELPCTEDTGNALTAQIPAPMLLDLQTAMARDERTYAALRFHETLRSPGYHAAMYCQPWGFKPPRPDEVKHHGAEPILPQPRNIHRLMEWLLAATGCIPAVSVHPVTGETHTGRISRPQDRRDNPANQEEAIARCILFENPGRHDRDFALADNPLQRFAVKLRMSREPNAT